MWKGKQTYLGDLQNMIINDVVSGMILQVLQTSDS